MSPVARRLAMFDSGLGGLTVYTALRAAMPDADIFYAADTARMPYGDRSLEEVASFARQLIAALRRFEPSLLVIACGTTCSAFAASGYRPPGLSTLAVVDCGIEAAAAMTAHGRFGVIATAATIGSGIFERKLAQARQDAVVRSVAAPKLVPIVEAGAWATDAAAQAVEEYCAPLVTARCDTVILGCTHYPHLRKWFERSLGPATTIVDPATACAAAAARALEDGARGQGSFHVLVSGDADAFARRALALSGVRASTLTHVDFSTQVEEAEHSHR